MNARRRHLRAAACLTLVGLLACLPLAAAFGSVNEDDMVLRLSAAERALPPDRLPDFDASCAALMDEDGTLWFGRNADDAAQIASLTKIMTAIVAADWLDASTMIEVTPEAASVGESSAGLAQGDSMTFDDALKALLAASGNDAASAIAQAAGARMLAQEGSGGDAHACEAAFVEAMNAKAAELGWRTRSSRTRTAWTSTRSPRGSTAARPTWRRCCARPCRSTSSERTSGSRRQTSRSSATGRP